jgi:hypothetical protein
MKQQSIVEVYWLNLRLIAMTTRSRARPLLETSRQTIFIFKLHQKDPRIPCSVGAELERA